MRSIKYIGIKILGCRMKPGMIYVLEFPDRGTFREFIFEFDSVARTDNSLTIKNRGKLIIDGDIDNPIEMNNGSLVRFPVLERVRLTKFKGSKNFLKNL